jgi:hypothetical protein
MKDDIPERTYERTFIVIVPTGRLRRWQRNAS